MPVILLSSDEKQVPSISVIGAKLESSRVVKHVALLPPLTINLTGRTPTLDYGQPVVVSAHLFPKVIHVRGEGFSIDDHIKPYVLGWMNGIDPTDAMKTLKTVLEDVLTRIHDGVLAITWCAHPPYSTEDRGTKTAEREFDSLSRIHPAQTTIRGEEDKPIGWSFSCAGFVLWCFKEMSGISLLADEPNLPDVSLQEVIAFFRLQDEPEAKRQRILEEMGFVGKGPWKVVFPGYVIHSLIDGAVIPYQPSKVDASYPL